MQRRVVITGLGTYNPLGNDPDSTWERIAASESGISSIEHLEKADLKTQFGGAIKNFDPIEMFGRKKARRMDRTTQFALAAANQALEDAQLTLTPEICDTTGVVLGCGMGNIGATIEGINNYNQRGAKWVSPFFIPMMLADSPAATVSITHGLRGPNMAIATACAAGNNALGEAAKMIQRGAAEVMLAGGAEAPLWPAVIAGFNATGALSTHWMLHPRSADVDRGSCFPGTGRVGLSPGVGASVAAGGEPGLHS